jgi:hypothetical protein
MPRRVLTTAMTTTLADLIDFFLFALSYVLREEGLASFHSRERKEKTHTLSFSFF